MEPFQCVLLHCSSLVGNVAIQNAVEHALITPAASQCFPPAVLSRMFLGIAHQLDLCSFRSLRLIRLQLIIIA